MVAFVLEGHALACPDITAKVLIHAAAGIVLKAPLLLECVVTGVGRNAHECCSLRVLFGCVGVLGGRSTWDFRPDMLWQHAFRQSFSS